MKRFAALIPVALAVAIASAFGSIEYITYNGRLSASYHVLSYALVLLSIAALLRKAHWFTSSFMMHVLSIIALANFVFVEFLFAEKGEAIALHPFNVILIFLMALFLGVATHERRKEKRNANQR